MQADYETDKINSYTNLVCKYFFGYPSSAISVLTSVDNNQLSSADRKTQSTINLAHDLLSCKDVDSIKDFYREAKDLVHPEELRPIFDQIKSEYLSQISANYGAALMTDDKAATLGLKANSISYQGQEIPTYQVDGQDFTILTHKLGAFGSTDLSDPSVWDTRTSGNPYISTSLIGNKCLHLAGGTDKKALSDGIFYGFGQLEPHSVLAMSQEDLMTHQDEGFKHDLFKEDQDNTKISTGRKEVWYQNPDDLLAATLNSKWEDDYSHNEVVLDRYKESGDRLHPTCIISFGTDPSQISQESLKHAAYFNVPVYLINDKKCKKRKGILS